MARLLFRCCSTLPAYPYHAQPRAQRFLDFPLHFRSPRPSFFNPGESEFLTGAIAAFHTLLTLMSQPTTLDELDSVAEWNLSQRLKEQLARLKNEGLQVKLTGETAKTEAVALDVHFTGGSLFPFRNLNLPVTEYLHTSRMMNHAEVDFFFIKQSEKVRKVKELLEIDLKDLNKREKKERDMEIRQIQSGLKLIPLIIKTVDVGIVSKHKLWISDSSGELLDGDSTSEKEEFHTLRLEKVLEPHLGLLRWLPPWSTYQQWLEKQLTEFTQWTIADVDGWMAGNPLTK